MFVDAERDILLVVDIQNDFCPQQKDMPEPALPVPYADRIIAPINDLMAQFNHIILTQDWHSTGHRCFASSYRDVKAFTKIKLGYGDQILWPDHCVMGSWGAELHEDLIQDQARLIVRKGINRYIDSYSAFFENDRVTPTGLGGYLESFNANQRPGNLFIVGLAFDFCVSYSAVDAAQLGYSTVVLADYTATIDVDGSRKEAIHNLKQAGVKIL